MRYPLVEVQGNKGNIIGDSAAASRYTECKLSPIGDLMLEDIEKNCVKFKSNYDDTEQEPCFLPSKFPNILCNGNNGIAVGLSSSLLPHNYNEVAEAIKYYTQNINCEVMDLLTFIKGPDFPTGGTIVNGEDIPIAYETGIGNFKVRGNYTIEKLTNGKTKIFFSDIPYMVELEAGIIQPIKKLVNEEGYTEFDDVYYEIVNGLPKVSIILNKNADVKKILDLIFTKTRLGITIKFNNTVIVDGEPKLFNLKQLISSYVNYRSKIIQNIARNDFEKANHKLTVVIGLQKCLTDIDKLIKLIREANDRNAAKTAIKNAFALTDEQADAVLDIKLSRLSKLDIKDLENNEKDLEKEVSKQKDIISNEEIRFSIIRKDLDSMKSICGDSRQTQIEVNKDRLPIEQLTARWINITSNGVSGEPIEGSSIGIVKARSANELYLYTASGDFAPAKEANNAVIGASLFNKPAIICVTKNGNIKVSSTSEYNFNRKSKGLKLKDGDELLYSAAFGPQDSILLFNGTNILRIPFEDFNLVGKLTQGVKSGFTNVMAALVVNDIDYILTITSDNKGKITPVKDFSLESKGSKGQSITENTKFIILATDRDEFYLKAKNNKIVIVPASKISLKSKNSIGATLSSKDIIYAI